MTVDLTGLPNAGETVQFRFDLAGRQQRDVTLTATHIGDAGTERVHHRPDRSRDRDQLADRADRRRRQTRQHRR